MYNPIATYRFQFHQKFTFSDFEKIIGYLQKLGVSTVYASPIFESTPGSTHGYDGVNPQKINPEIGTEQQLKSINKKLKTANMGWLQDIVPNHMGVHPNNPWLMDVLEKGPESAYASFFDTGLASDLFEDQKIMMPFLGSPLADVIQNKELKVIDANGKLMLAYYDNKWPVNADSYKLVLPNNESDDAAESAINKVNENAELLTKLAESQYYRLCSWEETDTQINYRRFFTVNSLMCLNIQDPQVFAQYHQYTKTLLDQGIFQGLRIDHIDGLYDPENYLYQLRELAGDETYIVAEKILEQGEDIPHNWPMQGNTGYDFLAQVNNLFTDNSSFKKFTTFYQDLVGDKEPVARQILTKKAHILTAHMQGELSNLLNYFTKLRLADEDALKTVGVGNLKAAIGKVLIYCPVYRYYGNQMPLSDSETGSMRSILNNITKENKELKPACELLDKVLLQQPHENKSNYNQRVLKFYQRLMQFSGPLMAKGVEDTLMYTYNRFIGHNEVGDAPESFGLEVKEFHKLMVMRQKHWPLSINGTSTHDTKRGEDVRARLNALTAMPGLWFDTVKQWQKPEQNTSAMPDANDRYFIYQTIAGAYPMPGQGDDEFNKRLSEYLTKALREGKVNSNWAKPNEDYEKATLDFVSGLLDQQSGFWQSFVKFQEGIADHGIINSLAQVLLKFTCPGVPDVYQGCELWDLNLVDPDNRRPVDYELRQQLLNRKLPADSTELINQLWEDRYSGHIKLWLTQLLFKFRGSEGDLFAKGEYIPLKVKGAYKEHVIAFARRYQNKWIIVAAPLYMGAICPDPDMITAFDWKDTRVIIPAEAPTEWTSQFTGAEGKIKDNDLRISDLFEPLPYALIQLEHPENDRGAGILMHITSLPSAFGIGDMGPAAKTFANYLARCGQKYWQLLPLNPTGPDQNYSPYSSLCSMAGNALLISPVLLAKDGLLDEAYLNEHHLPLSDKVNFEKVEDLKRLLFDKAYDTFYKDHFATLKKAFTDFCSKESYWLDDFALYTAIRENHDGQPWYQWEKQFKSRNVSALASFSERSSRAIDKIKWLQFMFFRQWHQLKAYCHALNIKLFGDLPFYVSYDSADVWANQQLFALDKQGQMTGIAGVPPDYFNADGQLWGMPVYRWDVMKSEGYQWWINRLKKNMELFDLLRLDHFRAFSAYWEVPAGESTAKNGKWVDGPAADFFNAIKDELGSLPFVAEDLGDIDAPVFELRDQFNLPGMKVLQFAFGDEMPGSLYIPHNYDHNFLVYTGTHDNNTTLGWFHTDASKPILKQIEDYTGIAAKQKNINEILMRMAYASTAKVAIVPMQDVLGLDENARMNNPSNAENNWLWRMLPKLVTDDSTKMLINWVKMYNRQ